MSSLAHKPESRTAVRARLACASLGVVALLFVVLASQAASGSPFHGPLPGLDIAGFDKACGAAVDSKGDIYVSSAGESKIEVFDPEHKSLTSISDSNEPCSLSVSAKGELYVTDTKTGDVVRFTPNAYPFSGAPSYSAPSTVVATGKAKGIAYDSTDERLYAAEGASITVYTAAGTVDQIGEVQRVLPDKATGGTFKLSFKGQTTEALPYKANHAEVQAALENLSTIGAGNVAVSEGESAFEGRDHIITFTGVLAHANVEQIVCDKSGLTGTEVECAVETGTQGFSGHVGEGSLSNVTGVALYRYAVDKQQSKYGLYLAAADNAANRVELFGGSEYRGLSLTGTIDGSSTPDKSLGFGVDGAGIAADPGNESPGKCGAGLEPACKCAAVGEQACTAGHFFVYDDLHGVVDEFEPTGVYVTQIKLAEADPGFTDAKPTAIALDRSGDENDGTVYISGGAGLGAELLAYGPLLPPNRAPVASLTRTLEHAGATATDVAGDLYVVAGTKVHVYDSAGNELTEVEDKEFPFGVAVDSAGNLYVADKGPAGSTEQESVTYYTPATYPPAAGTKYSRHEPPLVRINELPGIKHTLHAIAVNPANDHLFVGLELQLKTFEVSHPSIFEYDSVGHISGLLVEGFGGTNLPTILSLGVYGKNGDVYVSGVSLIMIVNAAGVVTRITGAGGPHGPFVENGDNPQIAVDQSDGHVVAFDPARGAAEEFDASGAYVASFGKFTVNGPRLWSVAVDSSASVSRGVYVAYDEKVAGTPDVSAFGPLAYGEPPIAVTGVPDGFGGAKATLNGTVDPRGFDVKACRFEYVTEALYKAKGFAGASEATCVPDAEAIGKGAEPVAVHAEIGGVSAQERYDFRLVAENKYGYSNGDAVVFGPPVAATAGATPVAYVEATLRGTVDPSGLATRYWFEYGEGEAYGHSTPVAELDPSAPAGPVHAALLGLEEGTTYHFRLVAESEDATVYGADQVLTTLARRPAEACPNSEYRTGLSANMPDCRAYELVTPGDTRGLMLKTPGEGGESFSAPAVTADGPLQGGIASYFARGTLPGFQGTGIFDGYQARRETAEGPHPAGGWSSAYVGPSYTQAGGAEPAQLGSSPDQQYAVWRIQPGEHYEDSLPSGVYLRTPDGFEAAGRGNLGSDPKAAVWRVTSGGTHVIFTSVADVEEGAPAAGTAAVYDRAAGSSSAGIVSVKPDGSPFASKEDATYLGSTEDGSVVAFEVGGVLYLRRENVTVEVAAAPNTFAGVSRDGTRVFYAAGEGLTPAGLYACDTQLGPCAGSGSHESVQVAQESLFVYVSPDGSHVLFTSKAVLDPAKEGKAGADNLYVWDGSQIGFIGVLDPQDFLGFEKSALIRITRWTEAVNAAFYGKIVTGLAYIPVRGVTDGSVFVFQSHARLTSYDNKGAGEIYRYDLAAPPGERIVCISCSPDGAPPVADASFQTAEDSVTYGSTLIANLTANGREVVFQSHDRLVPEDANKSLDVYEWKADGAGWCKRQDGCLSLISSGQGEVDSSLFGMTADGHDVFFETEEQLLPTDLAGSPSVYDARVEGGIPTPVEAAPCKGDACQGQPTPTPSVSLPISGAGGSGNVTVNSAQRSGGKPRSLTRAQKLVRALKACTRKPKRKRGACKRQARRRYGAGTAQVKGAATGRVTTGRTGK